MKVRDKIVMLLFSCFIMGNMVVLGNIPQKDSLEIKTPLIFDSWSVDGFELEYGNDSISFLINVYREDPCNQYLEVVYNKNDSCKYIKIDSASTLDIFYVVHSLNCYLHGNDIVITFFYLTRDKLGGLEPFELSMILIYRDHVYRYWGIIPRHPDWDWDDYYEFHEDAQFKVNFEMISKQMRQHWIYIIEKYKRNFYDANVICD